MNGGILPDDNVRIYVPLDLNAEQILNRLQQIYRVMESPDDMNEIEFSYQVGKIINVLLEDESCAECFPYDVLNELKVEFGI